MGRQHSRRDFLTTSAVAGAGFFALAGLTPTVSAAANERLRIAGIGVGGKGHSDITQAGEIGDVVAICDIDENTLNATLKDLQNPESARPPRKQKHNPKTYFDYRKMLDEMGKQIDAVTVSIPDHQHAPATAMALHLGKHAYTQKPLTHTPYGL